MAYLVGQAVAQDLRVAATGTLALELLVKVITAERPL
jgi:hypothetical protein